MKVFVIGFPKSATKTLNRAFKSIGVPAFHQSTSNGQNVSRLMYKGFRYHNGNPLYLLNHDFPHGYAVTEADYTNPSRDWVYWPQLDHLLLRNGFFMNPGVKYIYNYRDPHSLLDSFARWKGGDFRARVRDADLPGLPAGTGDSDEDLINWFNWHYHTCRDMFRPHPNNFLDVDIQSPHFRESVEDFLSVKFGWWGKENVNDQD